MSLGLGRIGGNIRRTIEDLKGWFVASRTWIWVLVLAILAGAAWSGYRSSPQLLVILVALAGLAVLLQWPLARLLLLVFATLVLRMSIGTGSMVSLTAATVLVPAMLGLWVLEMMRQHKWRLVPSRANRPLLLFILAGLLSLLVGNVYWDPAVPRPENFTIVQLGQWAIFCFSGGAFWLAANLLRDEASLRRLTFFFLAVGGSLVILSALPSTRRLATYRLGYSMGQATFLMLIAALAGGQLLFNPQLGRGWRWFLVAVLGAEAIFVFFVYRDIVSYMVGVVAVMGALAWLRYRRIRWVAMLLVLVLLATGLLTSAVYELAGGRQEWTRSGGSRLALSQRVIEVSMRNPITGIGPAAYRYYARMKPLAYGRAFWVAPNVNSHNNYVDLFSQLGFLGFGLFAWFAVEVTQLGLRVRRTYPASGFAAGYANAMLAAWAGSLALMLFADWILPFVYNIGFRGFEASVQVWLFLGGLVALENWGGSQTVSGGERDG